MENNVFKTLKSLLPHGFSTEIVRRLAERQISVSARHVQMVAKGERRNADIEAEILAMLDEPAAENEFEKALKAKFAGKGL